MTVFTPSLEQTQAIQCEGDMVIVARPGSGKTSVLSCKVRNLVSELRPYQGIIAISFTNKASDELERRCKADAFDVKSSFFGTIDDFCLREIVFPFARQLMPMAAELETVKVGELPESVRRMLPATPIQNGSVANTAEFLPFLQEALAQGFVPLEAVGMLASHVIDQSLACQKYLTARYCGVFIDEYQDSGYFQHQLFLKLKTLGLTAVAVGDGDQSIYVFAHKDPRYLLALTVPGSGFAYFAITTNFRSHPSISDFALRLLNPNHPIAPTNEMRVFIKTIDGNQRAMGTWLETAIPHLMQHFQVESAGRVAILCRHQHSARLIADHLNLAHHLVEVPPFETTPSAEASIYSDLLNLRYDQQLTAETLIERAGALKLASQERRALRRAILSCRSCVEGDLVTTVLDAAIRLTGRQSSPAGTMELRAICADADKLRRFQSPSRDAVQIMTLHKAKGLEFDIVFHADLYDHVIPARLYPPNTFQVIFANEIQCLNLHYVGITRAIKACVLMTSTSRINGQGEVKNGAPSQFIGRNGTSAISIPW
ncbi:UvrD-helicase domain-containing protein [Pseudomonas sp. T8]|uniref:UvrD-helicase domain-containing protein n=1 Tax=Pseudomonas sp. T8 TaxID=645292 RepID=UPI002147B05A|nr:ATP-dependent helicase [Pseudomonas sp. T8]UUT22942.1 ATP-dependent helicase [Pseudomonas sp. T8]